MSCRSPALSPFVRCCSYSYGLCQQPSFAESMQCRPSSFTRAPLGSTPSTKGSFPEQETAPEISVFGFIPWPLAEDTLIWCPDQELRDRPLVIPAVTGLSRRQVHMQQNHLQEVWIGRVVIRKTLSEISEACTPPRESESQKEAMADRIVESATAPSSEVSSLELRQEARLSTTIILKPCRGCQLPGPPHTRSRCWSLWPLTLVVRSNKPESR